METPFRDRNEAGNLLADMLSSYARHPEAVVLALPRGGVPIAYHVARKLQLPLDVFVVRKLGVPGYEELAMGAIAPGGVRVMNKDILSQLRVSEQDVEAVARRELKELERREKAYRHDRPAISLAGKTILLVDDGVATGATMAAAIKALRAGRAQTIVVAVPTIAADSLPYFEDIADDVVAVITPEDFVAVGKWYDDFSQTSDAEVVELLEKGRHFQTG